MKLIALTIFFSSLAIADVTYHDCLEDAKLNGNSNRAVAPLSECSVIVLAQNGKIETSSGPYRAYGKDHIIYLDKKDAEGKIIERTLLAGDQTELVKIQNLFIDTVARRLYVTQHKDSKNELLIYNLDFIGNVTPLNVIKADKLMGGVTSVKAQGKDKIEIINGKGTYLINADAEDRASRSVQKKLIVTPK